MTPRIVFHFDWDPAKATANRRKHGVAFETAVGVFSDPLSITVHDSGHSENEERWITIGAIQAGAVIVVSHTFSELKPNGARVRVISARPATPRERRQYEEGQFSVHEGLPMQDEYDFSTGERGKFYRKGAEFEIPIYLKPEVLAFFTARANEEGASVDEVLNRVLESDIQRRRAAIP